MFTHPDEQVAVQLQDDVEFNEDTVAQSEQFDSPDGESDGEQCVDNEGVDRTSDDGSATPDADEYEKDEQVSESNVEAAKVSNESIEDEDLSDERTSIKSDVNGQPVSNEDANSVDDDTVASERSQTMQDSHRRGRWIPQCRNGGACDALRYGMQGGHGCRFYHSAREVFEASRTYGRCEDSAQWQTRGQHEISDDDPDEGPEYVSYVGCAMAFSIGAVQPTDASRADIVADKERKRNDATASRMECEARQK